MHFVPSEAHHLDQKCLDQAVAPDGAECHLPAFRREVYAAVRLTLQKAFALEALHHLHNSRRRNLQALCQRGNNHGCGLWLLQAEYFGEILASCVS